MTKRHRKQRNSRGHGRATPPGTTPIQSSGAHHSKYEEPDILDDVREMLREDHPIHILHAVSQLMEVTREHPLDRFGEQDEEAIDLSYLLMTLREVERTETSALLTVFREFTTDDVERRRIDRELSSRHNSLPSWLQNLADVRVTGTWRMSHTLGDGDNIYIGLRWPRNVEMTVMIYIDHNMGTLVKDAFVVPESLEHMLAFSRKHNDDPANTNFEQLDPPAARTHVAEAIETADHTLDAPESETWPECRALVEWVLRQLPEGGTGYEFPEWTESQQQDITSAFLASPFSKELSISEDEQVGALHPLLWFGCDYPPCDPYRWSPVNVEIVLADWYPRKVMDTPEALAVVPAVLRAYVRFCHAERNIDPELTRMTLESLDEYAPLFLEKTMRGRSPILERFADFPPEALARIAALDIPDDYFDIEDKSTSEYMLDDLAEQVGGHEVLDKLDANALPDEEFDWNGIAPDVVERVKTVMSWSDRFCSEQLTVEHRTACRRLLKRVACNDPEIFRRKSRDDYAAGAFVWLMGQFNDVFSPYGPFTIKESMEFFNVKNSGSVSGKGQTLRKAARLPGWDHYWSARIYAGDPELLTSKARERIIHRRDRARELDDE